MRNHDTLNKDLIFGRNEDFMISISEYPVPVLTGDFSHKTIHVKVPGSKSITNRALLLAMLSDGKAISPAPSSPRILPIFAVSFGFVL